MARIAVMVRVLKHYSIPWGSTGYDKDRQQMTWFTRQWIVVYITAYIVYVKNIDNTSFFIPSMHVFNDLLVRAVIIIEYVLVK